MHIRPALSTDLPLLHPVIERAYRGDSARRGWTHEADLLDGDRIDRETLEAIVADTDSRLLMAEQNEIPLGCVHVRDLGDHCCYLGLLCIDPAMQSGGLGRTMIAAAERCARDEFGAQHVVMTVIEQRHELIAFYVRRGYAPTGRRVDFPIALDPPLYMTELGKTLGNPAGHDAAAALSA